MHPHAYHIKHVPSSPDASAAGAGASEGAGTSGGAGFAITIGAGSAALGGRDASAEQPISESTATTAPDLTDRGLAGRGGPGKSRHPTQAGTIVGVDLVRALVGLGFLVLFAAGVFALMKWNARASMDNARRAAVEAGLTLVEGTWRAHLETYEGQAAHGELILRYVVRVGRVPSARVRIDFPRSLTSPLLRGGPLEWSVLPMTKVVGGVWFAPGRAHPVEAWTMIPPEIHARLQAHEVWRETVIALNADHLELSASANALERASDTRELTDTLVLVAQHLVGRPPAGMPL